jgi:hypothetical protein
VPAVKRLKTNMPAMQHWSFDFHGFQYLLSPYEAAM